MADRGCGLDFSLLSALNRQACGRLREGGATRELFQVHRELLFRKQGVGAGSNDAVVSDAIRCAAASATKAVGSTRALSEHLSLLADESIGIR